MCLSGTDLFFVDYDGTCSSFDPDENGYIVKDGDLIQTGSDGQLEGGAYAYYARNFDSASSTTSGYQDVAVPAAAIFQCVPSAGLCDSAAEWKGPF